MEKMQRKPQGEPHPRERYSFTVYEETFPTGAPRWYGIRCLWEMDKVLLTLGAERAEGNIEVLAADDNRAKEASKRLVNERFGKSPAPRINQLYRYSLGDGSATVTIDYLPRSSYHTLGHDFMRITGEGTKDTAMNLEKAIMDMKPSELITRMLGQHEQD